MKPTHRVVFSQSLLADIQDFLVELAPKAGATAARRYVDRLIDHCRGFERFPERGARRDEIRPGLRVVGWRRATIAFRIDHDVVIIVRILFRGRNLRDAEDIER
ncbi:type II toxin-antitoxin system RelE/ParE family toxin [Mangrovibrevibacter kandeliae]|uniref:type II toxin-antitoxin system RelE/ParE family toxin n=1 Tax=Mangrovibrevibacter kandeliae TaxID=2968473 RepID=UPI002118AD1C|nr:type II toxin-antitoxin system RelE/ParE family toxin [Aurantimonas sp. CSK15Z-1]